MEKNSNNELRKKKYRKIALALLIVGACVLATGIGLMVWFWTSERRRLIPISRSMMFIGSVCLRFGIIGPLSRFNASVVAPAQKDYLNYRREETADSAKEYYKDVASGFKEGWKEEEGKACPHCGKKNPKDAKFCNSCGKPFEEKKECPYCHQENPSTAKFCSHCGKEI